MGFGEFHWVERKLNVNSILLSFSSLPLAIDVYNELD